jgi:hypothetical protein
MKKPTREEQWRMCTRKRRYKTQADALDAAALLGLERQRTPYRCPICGHWHLSTSNRD